MNLNLLIKGYLVFGLTFLVQFIVIPSFAEVSRGPKAFIFIFIVLALAGLSLSNSSYEIQISKVFQLLILLWCLFFASSFSSFSPHNSFFYTFFFGLALILLGNVTSLAKKDINFIENFTNIVLFCGVLSACLGLYQYLSFLCLGSSEEVLIPYLLPPNTSYRVFGPYGQPNLFALFISICLLVFFYKYLHRPDSFSYQYLRRLRFIPFFLLSLVFLLTWSRAGLLSFLITLGFVSWLVASGRYLSDDPSARKEFLRLLFCLLVAFFSFKVLGWFGPAVSDHARNFAGVSVGTEGRFVFWTSSALMALDYPLLGVGLNNFRFLLDEYLMEAHGHLKFVSYESLGYTDWSHNEFLQIACEGGILAFIIIVVLIVSFFRALWSGTISKPKVTSPLFLYSHVYILPFIFQSNFSWPLRHPSLMALFVIFLGILLSQYPCKKIILSKSIRFLLKFFVFVTILGTFYFLQLEMRLGDFVNKLSSSDRIEESFTELVELSLNPFCEFRVLKKAIPLYTSYVINKHDVEFAEKILPYAKRLADLQGAYWQWYNLALLNRQIGQLAEARTAIIRAIDLQPTHEPSWNFLHYLNMLKASEETGRPLDDFMPSEEHGGYKLPETFNVGNRPLRHQ